MNVVDPMSNQRVFNCSNSAAEGATEQTSNKEQHWRAVRVRPRWEKTVRDALSGKEYEAFLPLYRKRNRWSDRTQEVNLPLFPGYVFCRGDFSTSPRLITTPGVMGVVSFAGTPAIVTDDEIETIHFVLRSGIDAEPWTYVCEGDRVRIHSGALTGLQGILLRTKNECRVVLSVDALCRSYAVEVDRECVAPVSAPFFVN